MNFTKKRFEENIDYKIAQKKVQKLKGFYFHLIIYSVGLIVFILKEYCGVGVDLFPVKHLNFFAMAIWTIAFFITVLDFIISFQLFNKNWEERMIQRIIEKESINQSS